MNKKSMVLAAGLLVAAGGFAAMAAADRHGGFGFGTWGWGHGGWGGHKRTGMMGLKRLDADNDGIVTLDEFLRPKADQFASLDTNKDNVVEAQEMAVPMQERADYRLKRFMKRVDQNGDGKISLDEFEKGPKERFGQRDLNSDGKITAEDMPPGRKRHGSWGGWHGRGEGGRGKSESGEEHGGDRGMSLDRMLERTGDRFKQLDSNADGFIDQAELAAAEKERLDFATKRAMHRVDLDSDGKVTPEEFTHRARERFSTLDLNNDGKITVDDLPPGARSFWNNPDWQRGEKKG